MSQHFCHQAGYAQNDAWLTHALDEVLKKLDPAPGKTITYRQIDVVLDDAGTEPDLATQLYERILRTLEEHQVQVVEAEESDLGNDDFATEIADEVFEMLAEMMGRAGEFDHELLSAADERRLLEIYHDGLRAKRELQSGLSSVQQYAAERRIKASEEAIDTLMRCNLRLVGKIATRYMPYARHLTFDDLLQEGRIGLLKAIERFDQNCRGRLSTYAVYWIRQSIQRALADQDRMVRLPVHIVEQLHRLRKTCEQFRCIHGREPGDAELANALGVSLAKVRSLWRVAQHHTSIDRPVGADTNTFLGELIADDREEGPDFILEQQLLHAVLREVLGHLSSRERDILERRYGFIDGKTHTLEEIGQIFGLTRERIRQIEQKALKRLNRGEYRRILQHFLYQ
jgi:RNA polymerase sigma factor, sigma-70 family